MTIRRMPNCEGASQDSFADFVFIHTARSALLSATSAATLVITLKHRQLVEPGAGLFELVGEGEQGFLLTEPGGELDADRQAVGP